MVTNNIDLKYAITSYKANVEWGISVNIGMIKIQARFQAAEILFVSETALIKNALFFMTLVIRSSVIIITRVFVALGQNAGSYTSGVSSAWKR